MSMLYPVGSLLLLKEDNKQCLVRYVGATHFGEREAVFYGVELVGDKSRNGVHNGTFKGVRYFNCAAAAGLFVLPKAVSRRLTAKDFNLPEAAANELQRALQRKAAKSSVTEELSASGRLMKRSLSEPRKKRKAKKKKSPASGWTPIDYKVDTGGGDFLQERMRRGSKKLETDRRRKQRQRRIRVDIRPKKSTETRRKKPKRSKKKKAKSKIGKISSASEEVVNAPVIRQMTAPTQKIRRDSEDSKDAGTHLSPRKAATGTGVDYAPILSPRKAAEKTKRERFTRKRLKKKKKIKKKKKSSISSVEFDDDYDYDDDYEEDILEMIVEEESGDDYDEEATAFDFGGDYRFAMDDAKGSEADIEDGEELPPKVALKLGLRKQISFTRKSMEFLLKRSSLSEGSSQRISIVIGDVHSSESEESSSYQSSGSSSEEEAVGCGASVGGAEASGLTPPSGSPRQRIRRQLAEMRLDSEAQKWKPVKDKTSPTLTWL